MSDGLDGETLLATISVRFSPGMPLDINAAATHHTMYRPSVVQRHAFAQWSERSYAVGFPVAGPEMVLGVTAERLLVWRPTFLRTRAGRFAGAIPIERIHRAGMRRRILASVLVLLFEDGAIIGVETLRTSKLREFARAIPTFTDDRAR
jgi:hypothetical protein